MVASRSSLPVPTSRASPMPRLAFRLGETAGFPPTCPGVCIYGFNYANLNHIVSLVGAGVARNRYLRHQLVAMVWHNTQVTRIVITVT